MKTLDFSDSVVTIDGKSFQLEYHVNDTRIVDGRAIIIFKGDNGIGGLRQFQNCHAYNDEGELLWVAEHPTNGTNDLYLNFIDEGTNRLWNFACFVCELDFSTGKLKEALFTK
ncbi:MAG: hypothetical protein AAF944_25465 [Bacteroidota bacterium]